MKDLRIIEQKDSFGVFCSIKAGIIEFTGSSYPEDTLDFFSPIFDWLEYYTKNIEKKLSVDFKVDYFNSSSSKCILEFLDELQEYYEKGNQVSLQWFYDENDLDMREIADELLEDITFPYNLIAVLSTK